MIQIISKLGLMFISCFNFPGNIILHGIYLCFMQISRDFCKSRYFCSAFKIIKECASHVTLFSIQALSLELAALAIKGRNGTGIEIVRLRKIWISPLYLNIFYSIKKITQSLGQQLSEYTRPISFSDFVNYWYEKTLPELTKVEKKSTFSEESQCYISLYYS